MKVDLEQVDCNNLLQDFKFMKNIKITVPLKKKRACKHITKMFCCGFNF